MQNKYNDKNKAVTGAVKRIFETSDGKVLMEYLDSHYFDTISFCDDPYKTAFNEGGRDVVYDIKKRISNE